MSLKENISAAINSDINAQISSDAATNISEEVNSHISLKALSLKESGEIVNVNNITYSTVHDNINMYNNFVADDYYASKSWVLSKNYLTKDEIGNIDIGSNIEELLNNKADKNHNHDDRYYTKDNLDTWQTNLDLAFIDINDKLNNKADWDALYSKIDIAELDSFKSEINTTIDNFSAELSTKASIYDLDNLVNFDTFNTLNTYVYESCATKDEIPTKVSELANDKAYITTADLNNINELIPNAASIDNQLADKNFVNSSITTATADFRGTVESIEELNNLEGNLNDYAFYKHKDESGNTLFDRYKYTDQWEYEYTLNNSSFTSDQWEAINSGITANIVNNIPSKISDLINDSNFATTDNIPTKISELINDSSFITAEEAPNGVLSCKYGITTYQEIEDAILAGKMPVVYVNHTSTNRSFYRYNGTYNGKHIFISVYDGISENRSISVASNNTWSTSSVTNLVGSASETMITNRNNKSWGISTQNYDSAVRHALCDADGSTSYNPAYTNEQKAAARNKIGAASVSDIPTNHVTTDTDQTISGQKIFTQEIKLLEAFDIDTNVKLPLEYQRVSYIQSSGREYIDTLSRVVANTRFTCIYANVFNNGTLVKASDENKGYGQGNVTGANPDIAGGCRISSNNIQVWFNGANYNSNLLATQATEIYCDTITTSENTLSFSMVINNTTNHYLNLNLSNYTNYATNNMFLFRDSSGQYPFYAAKKIYSVKFEIRATSNDEFTTVKHFIPCYRISDNKPGLYDIINNDFYTNAGSGEFKIGDVIVNGYIQNSLATTNQIISKLSKVATSGNYKDLSNTPTIPTKLSSFVNDTNYITSADITKELILSLLTDAETQEF